MKGRASDTATGATIDSPTLRRIAVWLVLAVVLASVVVVAVTQYQRAERAESRVRSVRDDRTLTEDNLDSTRDLLSSTRRDLTRTSRSLDRSDRQTHACRYLAGVNDQLLFGMRAEQRATDELLKSYPDLQAAKDALGQAGDRADAITRLVEQAGYADISSLVDACAPPR